MFSSGASDLESVLRDVEPILRGNSDFQFTHPSFREVLTARQFADEINSGKLPVRDAYLKFWSRRERTLSERLSKEFRTVSFDWKSVLNCLSGMLSNSGAQEFLGVISEYSLKYRKDLDFREKREYLDRILEDFSLCAKCISLHHDLDVSKAPARYVIDFLMSFIKVSDSAFDSPVIFEYRVEKVISDLIQTRSTYVAELLVSYLNVCDGSLDAECAPEDFGDNEVDFGYSILRIDGILEQQNKDQQYENMNKSKNLAMKCLRGLDENGAKIPFYLPEVDYDSSEEEMWFVGRFGDKNCLKTLLDWMDDDFFVGPSRSELLAEEYHYYFGAVFEILRRHDFKPEMVKNLNENISKVRCEGFAEMYHNCLKEFTDKMFKTYNVNFHDHLQTKGIRLFDSWVYKPK